MNALDVIAAAGGVVFWLGLLVLLLRWPGRTIGFAFALLAWTVMGPWAFWAVIGLTALGAIARRRCGACRRSARRRRALSDVPTSERLFHPIRPTAPADSLGAS